MRSVCGKLVDSFEDVLIRFCKSSTEPEKFVIFTAGRSGSNFFLNLINQHPEVYCFSELYHPEEVSIGGDCDSAFLRSRASFWIRIIFPRLFIFIVWRLFRRKKIVGFKYVWFHTDKIRDVVLLNPSVKKVLLTRRNILRTEVSRQIADHTNKWISFEESNQCQSVQFDLPKFWRLMELTKKQIVGLKQSLEEKDQSYLEVFYEDLIGDSREHVLDICCKFLNISPWKFAFSKVITKRQNPFTLKEMLVNYDEVEQSLKGTEAEWMLYDEENGRKSIV